ncbi:hypothetical protein EVAR_21881_1 [Eumeta japonica]|uniref:Uncharacterized protein n=1 Tax=Eumeta variegata TaxID=151549 RepID=A0A4C1VB38_EUMVA|nr:hypothetical protein EVAR_21881_1 [Eumeta japonica]
MYKTLIVKLFNVTHIVKTFRRAADACALKPRPPPEEKKDRDISRANCTANDERQSLSTPGCSWTCSVLLVGAGVVPRSFNSYRNFYDRALHVRPDRGTRLWAIRARRCRDLKRVAVDARAASRVLRRPASIKIRSARKARRSGRKASRSRRAE